MGGYKTCTICGGEKRRSFIPTEASVFHVTKPSVKRSLLANGNTYERMIRLESQLNQLDEITAIPDMVNKLYIQSSNRNGVYEKDESGYRKV